MLVIIMIFLANSFSLQMLTTFPSKYECIEISKEKFDYYKEHALSYIGHKDLANLLNVNYNRESLKLREGDVLLVAQITGGRLPEGATTLPHNVSIKYLCVKMLESNTGFIESEKIKMEE